jgi:hypothetical protein
LCEAATACDPCAHGEYGIGGGGATIAFHVQVGSYDTASLIGVLKPLRRVLGGQKATLLSSSAPGWAWPARRPEGSGLGGHRRSATATTPSDGACCRCPLKAALVQRMFTLYADRRLGSAAISGLLNDAGQPPVEGDGGPPTASWMCCATPPTSGSSPSTASSIRPATSPSSTGSCSSGRSCCSPSAATHPAPRPPTPPTTC